MLVAELADAGLRSSFSPPGDDRGVKTKVITKRGLPLA